jgi:hypothetical protein
MKVRKEQEGQRENNLAIEYLYSYQICFLIRLCAFLILKLSGLKQLKII